MPKYRITDPNSGKVITISGTNPPTQADAEAIFNSDQVKKMADTRSSGQKVADFLGVGNIAKTAVMSLQSPLASLLIGKDDKQIKELSKQSQDLIKQATKETDPTKRKALLDQSREIDSQIETAGIRAQNTGEIVRRGGQITEKEMQMDKGKAPFLEFDKENGILKVNSPGEFALRRGGATALEAASYLAPGMIGGPTAKISQRIGQAALRGGVAGGLQGAAKGTEADTLGEAALQTGVGAVAGAGSGALIQGVLETPQIAKEWWNTTAKKIGPKARELYVSTLKENIADRKFFKQYEGGLNGIIDDTQKYQVANTKNGVTKQLEEYGPVYNDIINAETDRLQANGNRINLSRAFKDAQKTAEERFSHDETLLKQVRRWFSENGSKYKNSTNALPKTANELRKSFDIKVGDVLTADAAPADAARKAFATELRKEFKRQVSQETKDAIQKYQLLSGLSSAMKKEPVAGLAEATSAAAGAALGSIYGGPSAILAALGGLGLSTVARSPGIKRTISSGIINEAGRAAPQVVRSAINASPVVNPGVAALQRLIDKENLFKQTKKALP